MSAPNIPLARPVILGTYGNDVLAIKRALSRAGYIKWDTFTKTYGTFARDAVHTYQKDHAIPVGGYGVHTHAALTSTKASDGGWAWDDYSAQLMHKEYVLLHTNPEQAIRAKIIQQAKYLYSVKMDWRYSEGRPFELCALGQHGPHYDCSGFVTECHYAAGAPNPNAQSFIGRLPYNGEGYTGTLMVGGTKCARQQLKPGDAVMYGYTINPTPAFPYGSPTHVALWVGDGTVYSNGYWPMSHCNYDFGMHINCYVTYNVLP